MSYQRFVFNFCNKNKTIQKKLPWTSVCRPRFLLHPCTVCQRCCSVGEARQSWGHRCGFSPLGARLPPGCFRTRWVPAGGTAAAWTAEVLWTAYWLSPCRPEWSSAGGKEAGRRRLEGTASDVSLCQLFTIHEMSHLIDALFIKLMRC